jgi:hypothetical protein
MGIIPMVNHVAMAFGEDKDFSAWLQGKIVESLWMKKDGEGGYKQGRRLVAKKKLEASYELGGIELINIGILAKGLLLNFMERYLEGRVGGIMQERLELFLRMNECEQLDRMLRIYGPRIWEQFAVRIKTYSEYWGEVFGAVSEIMSLNEENYEGWCTAAVAGHSRGGEFISRADQIDLEDQGILVVKDLFGVNEFTGRMDVRISKEIRRAGEEGREELQKKCDMLRKEVLEDRKNTEQWISMPFFEVIKQKKKSKMIRELYRKNLDRTLRFPGSYKTRMDDGYALPAVSEYKQGYKDIMKTRAESRTKEISFLILSRQTWTKQKFRCIVERNGERISTQCSYCEEEENTFHMIWGCEEYAQKVWKETSKVLTELEGKVVNLTCFNVMYASRLKLEKLKWQEVNILVMEIKRDILRRACNRWENPNLNRIQNTENRIWGHLLIVIRGINSYRKQYNKRSEMFEKAEDILKERF